MSGCEHKRVNLGQDETCLPRAECTDCGTRMARRRDQYLPLADMSEETTTVLDRAMALSKRLTEIQTPGYKGPGPQAEHKALEAALEPFKVDGEIVP